MKPPRLLSAALAVLVLVGPGAARGQEAPADEPAQEAPPELTPPPLVPVPPPGSSETPPRRPRPPEGEGPRTPAGQDTPKTSVSEQALPDRAAARKEDPVPRVAVEFVGGATGGIVAGTVGVLAGYLLAAPTVGCDECQVVALVGGFTGVLLGIPAGTWAGGRLMGGRGEFASAALGSAVGWGGALLGAQVLGASSEDDTLALVLLVLPVIGATAGYELSHTPEPAAPAPPASRTPARLQVIPVAGMTGQGPRLGLMGRF